MMEKGEKYVRDETKEKGIEKKEEKRVKFKKIEIRGDWKEMSAQLTGWKSIVGYNRFGITG